jgi:hypothetical protein
MHTSRFNFCKKAGRAMARFGPNEAPPVLVYIYLKQQQQVEWKFSYMSCMCFNMLHCRITTVEIARHVSPEKIGIQIRI